MTDPRREVHPITKAVLEKAAKPVLIVDEVVQDTADLLHQSGPVRPGRGLTTTIIALGLGFLCLLGVLAFWFPQYLTTPELRQQYSVQAIRTLMFGSLVVAGALSLVNIVLNRRRSLNLAALAMVAACIGLGGSAVPVGAIPEHTPYLGLDWFILDLLGSTVVFVALEKLFPLYRNQPVFRKEWQTDLRHFAVNHLLVGLMLFIVNFFVHRAQHLAGAAVDHSWVTALPFVPQLLLCVFVADLAEYWVHRAYHEVPWLWRMHAIHHSVKTLDWLAGSRLHLLEIIITRVAVLTPIFLLGFDKAVIDGYILVVGFQAVFNHANVHLPWGPLKYVFVTPDFHHWHHSSESVAIDRNYAAHFAFLDRLFGTAVKTDQRFPTAYGVVGMKIPETYLLQQAYPFKKRKKKPPVA